MRKVSRATVATILAIALYFTAAWGLDALRAFASPSYGLDDVFRAQAIFALGSLFALGPIGMIKLAAFIAAMKFVAAAACALHVADRFRTLAGGEADVRIFEGGLIAILLIAMLSAAPAIWTHNAEMVRAQAIDIALAALAIALCTIERNARRAAEAGDMAEEIVDMDDAAEPAAAIPAGAKWFSPWR